MDSKDKGTPHQKKDALIYSFFPFKRNRNDPKLWNRMKICALSIFLLWSCSLKNAAFIASYAMEVPSIATFYHSCKSASQIARDEKVKFTKCTKTQVDQCKFGLDILAERESRRIMTASEFNSKVIGQTEIVLEACSADFNDLKSALKTWSGSNSKIPQNNGTCTAEEEKVLTNSVVSIDSYKSEAFLVSAKYENESKNTMDRIVDYTQQRFDYDQDYISKNAAIARDYFIDNLPVPLPLNLTDSAQFIMESVEDWASCLSMASDSSCELLEGLEIQSARQLILDFNQEMRVKSSAYVSKISDIYKQRVNEVKELHNEIVEVALVWQKLFMDMKKVMKYVNDRLPKKKSGGWFDMTISNILVPDFSADIFAFQGNLKIPQRMIDAANKIFDEHIQATAQESYDHIMGLIAANFSSITEEYTQWMDDVRYTYSFEDLNFFLDYDPPRYSAADNNISSLNNQRDAFTQKSQEFITEAMKTINNVANATRSMDGVNDDTIVSSDANIDVMEAEINNFDIEMEELTKPGIDFDLWIFGIVSLGDIFFLVDFAFRAYFSIRLIFKYWSVSSVSLPQVDIRKEKEVAANPLEWNQGRLVIAIISNPLTGLLVATVIISWIVTFTTSVYTPLFGEYRSGCIPKDANGTFVSSNLYSTAYNYAYKEGSSLLVEGAEMFEASKNNICSSNFISSANNQNDDAAKLAGNSQVISTLQRQMNVFDKCIDIELIDTSFSVTCCGQPGYPSCDQIDASNYTCPMKDTVPPIPFQRPGQYFERSSCHIDLNNAQLKSAVFDCSVLPSCDVTCIGPQKEKLRKAAKECSCIGEWLFHAYWLRGVLSFLIFIILNISRVTLVDGLARILWKNLNPGAFTVWATCDSSGTIITNRKEGGGNQHSFQDDDDSFPQGFVLTLGIKNQLKWNAFKFRMMGVMMVLSSLSLNAIWIAIVVQAKDDLHLTWL